MDRESPKPKKRRKVLFLCYGNSCRSILAEALARHFRAGDMEACSAGLFPLGHITRHTLEALEEAGLSSAGLYSKGLSDVRLDQMDYLVNLTDIDVGEFIPPFFSGGLISHYVPDPYGEGLDSFRAALEELKRFVRDVLPGLIAESEEGQARRERG